MTRPTPGPEQRNAMLIWARICETTYSRVASRFWWLSVSAVLISASCQQSSGEGSALPATPPVVDVTLTEYRIEYDAPIPAGRVVFRVHNRGSTEHQLKMLPLSDDTPPIHVQLSGSERRAVAPYAGVPALAPSSSSAFAVDLVPGTRYAVLCLLPGKDGAPHALRGMNSEFRIPEQGNDEPRHTETR